MVFRPELKLQKGKKDGKASKTPGSNSFIKKTVRFFAEKSSCIIFLSDMLNSRWLQRIGTNHHFL